MDDPVITLETRDGEIGLRITLWTLLLLYFFTAGSAPDMSVCTLRLNGENVMRPAWWGKEWG
jgi:hypothetical protein